VCNEPETDDSRSSERARLTRARERFSSSPFASENCLKSNMLEASLSIISSPQQHTPHSCLPNLFAFRRKTKAAVTICT
jgi:hypothetical protein